MPDHVRSRFASSVAMATAGTLLGIAAAGPAWAWGHSGHVNVSRLAMLNLPADLPKFLRAPHSAMDVGELGAEPDVSKSTGIVTGTNPSGSLQTARTVHDAERDPGHYIDIDENGLVLGGVVALAALPPTREAFDTAQRAATSPGDQDQYSAGYLPYTIIDGFQQVRKDFGIWRALSVGLRTATTEPDQAYFRYQLQLRQRLILRDIGTWSHFVADASQPMHVSIHFNGWGKYPNPNGYTTAPIHAPFEGSFVSKFVDFNVVNGQVRPYTDRGVGTIEQRVPLYLAETLDQLVPAYAAAQASGDDNYQTAQPAELAIVTQQLAAAVAELRDEIVDAWRQSALISIGFPQVRVSDIESHAVPMTTTTLGAD